ncbi:DUF2057 domain-containing protein [Vibrio sp. 10N.261.55.A7]|uniref:YccT family protein n=1 Tax=Vibrio sp. 10N.261.55.A7 TaxID=1880851 RepID=UPI000C84F98C|nr:DUF2057 domain-containing protein [Vibrio sp. 10N.261.55.A7]PMJ90472.1 hypothetical protein BCU12_11960 [Vibrio sp. 10N.261.55.A7]
MKVINKMLVVGAMITSFAPMAAVDLTIDRNISALVVNGEEVGFSFTKKEQYVFENGPSQIVLRVEQLVENLGEKEKFNSQPVVLTFDSKDDSLKVSTGYKISRTEQADDFNKEPRFIVTDKSGKEVKVKQDILPASSGISRDYLKELARYNSKNSITLPVATTAAIATNTGETQKVSKPASNDSKSTQMVEYWYEKASSQDKAQFTDWAFDNRNTQDLEAVSGTKEIEMASYWFSQGTVAERKKTLAWLLEQE